MRFLVLVAVQEVVQISLILSFGLIDATVNSTGELTTGSRSPAGLLTLGEDLSDVGVVGLFHKASIGPPEGESDHRCDSLGTGHQDRFLTELLLISLCYLFTSHFDSNIRIIVDDGENERAFGFAFPIALAFRERETIQTVCNFIGDKAFEH